MPDKDDPRATIERLLPQGFLVPPNADVTIGVVVNAAVQHVTPEAAQAMVAVAEATYVKPKQVVMRGTILGTALIAASCIGVLWLGHLWTLSPWETITAMLVIGVPFGLVAAKVLPKLVEQAATGRG